MMFTIRGFLERCATRRVVLAALAGAVVCVAGLLWRQERLGGLSLLDGRGWYTPEAAAALFEALDRLDAHARAVCAATGLTIDMAFPAAYGLLLALPLFHLFRARFCLLPLAAAADALENRPSPGAAMRRLRATVVRRNARAGLDCAFRVRYLGDRTGSCALSGGPASGVFGRSPERRSWVRCDGRGRRFRPPFRAIRHRGRQGALSFPLYFAGSPGRRVAGSPGRRVAGSPGRRSCVRVTAMRALSWLRGPWLSASPPESSRSAGGRSDTHRRPASSSDSFDLSAARALRRGLAAGLLALPLLAGLPDGAQAQTAPECSTANADGSYTIPNDWALKPSGVNRGETFRLLFVTTGNEAHNLNGATATDIATYNTRVQTSAKAGHGQISDSCGNLFKIVGSTSAVDARANIDAESTDTDAEIHWLNGAKVADDYADFWDGSWDSRARKSQTGADSNVQWVYTGSNANGTKDGTYPLGAARGRLGNLNVGGQEIRSNNTNQNNSYAAYYGMSPVFKVATLPVVTISNGGPATITEGGIAQFSIEASPALPDGTVVNWRIDSADPHSSPRVWYVHEAWRNTTWSETIDYSQGDDGLTVFHNIATTDNDIIEASTYITVTLLPGTGYRVGKSSVAKVWVEDNDEPRLCGNPTPVPTHYDNGHGNPIPPAVRNRIKMGIMSATTFEFSELSFRAPGAGEATVTVKRTGTAAASVNYETGDGTLKAASDGDISTGTGGYAPTSGTLRWAAGDGGTKSFKVPVGNVVGDFRVFLSDTASGGVCHYAEKKPPGSPVPGGVKVWVDRTTPPATPVITTEETIVNVTERDGKAVVTVRKFGKGAATVDYGTVSFSAVAPGDYTHTAGTLTFGAGELELQTIEVPIVFDAVQELQETLLVNLTNPSGGILEGGTQNTTVVIAADAALPVIGFTSSTYTGYEGEGTVTLTVTRTGVTEFVDSAACATVEGTATDPEDYTVTGNALSADFEPGETETTCTVTLVDDGVTEAPETFRVTLRAITNVGIGTSEATVTVHDGDRPMMGLSLPPPVTVTISADATSVTEGGDVIFTVTANPAPQADLTVSVSADQEMGDGGTAVASTELGTVTVKAGETSATWTVTAMSDSIERADGTMKGSIVAGDGYTRGTPHEVTLDLLDDDAPPKGQISTTTPAVEIPAALIAGVRDLAGQTHHGQAHVNRWKRVLMAFGLEDYAGLTATTAAEAKANADKFSSPLWPQIATILEKIEAAASLPVVTVAAGAGVTEGGDAVFTLTASPAPASSLPVSVTVSASGDWGVTTGSATATFQAGASTATVTLPTTDDQADEADGSITLTVGTGTGYTVGSASSASVAVADNDDAPATPLPVVTVSASPDVTEGGNVAFSLSATPAPAAAISVSVTVAVDGDWGVTAETHTVTVGTNGHGALRFATTDDDVDEPDGSITATLNDGTGYTVGTTSSASVAVADNDLPLPVVTVAAGADVTEGNNAVFTFTASRAPEASFQASVTVAEAGGGDHVGADNEGGHSVTFPKGVTTATLEIATTDDGANEPDGTVTATLEDGTGYEVGTPSSGTVAVADDDDPVVTVAAVADVTEGGDAVFTFTASPVPYAALPVSVTVAADGDWGVTAGSRTVTFAAGAATATLTLATTDDSADEADGSVSVTVGSGTGYTVGTASSASVAVADDDDAPVNNLPALYVDDATKAEGGLPVMEFTVRLSPAASAPVSVHVSTRPSDPESAEPKVDYMPGSYDVTFRPGDTERQIYIWIHDDSHNEDPETFEVVLSKVQGAVIGDGVAIGTITNDDPMPAAWLARFGRTVAEQALDGIAGRMAASRTAGMQGAIAGQSLSFDAPAGGNVGPGHAPGGDAFATTAPDGTGALALTGIAQAFGGHAGPSGHGSPGFGHGDFGNGHGFDTQQPYSQTMTAREALLGSSFSLTGERDGTGGSMAFWGRAAQGSFDGREGTFSLDGEATTAMLGADYARGTWLIGLAVAQSSGEGDYRDIKVTPRPDSQICDGNEELCDRAVRAGDGSVEASLTAAIPYAALRVSERLKLWGAAGHGTGEVTLKTAMGDNYKSDTGWSMAAAGLRGDLLEAPAGGGPAIAVTSDALWTRSTSDKTRQLAASESDATRLRLGLEGSWRIAMEGGGELVPKVEIGARHDGGDAETGFGVELGGGLAWVDPGIGLTLDVSGRTLVAHGNDDLKDRGFAASLAFDPNPATKRGLSLDLRQDWGGQAHGGLDALFRPVSLGERTGSEATSRWAMEAAYGFPAFGGRFTGSPHVGFGLATAARDYSLGWRLAPEAASAPHVSFDLRAARRESGTETPEHTVGFEVRATW